MEYKHVINTPQRNLNRAKPTRDPAENGNRDFPSDAMHGREVRGDKVPRNEKVNGWDGSM
jgi:hypothetical protein